MNKIDNMIECKKVISKIYWPANKTLIYVTISSVIAYSYLTKI